jgi:hypothetical protein
LDSLRPIQRSLIVAFESHFFEFLASGIPKPWFRPYA